MQTVADARDTGRVGCRDGRHHRVTGALRALGVDRAGSIAAAPGQGRQESSERRDRDCTMPHTVDRHTSMVASRTERQCDLSGHFTGLADSIAGVTCAERGHPAADAGRSPGASAGIGQVLVKPMAGSRWMRPVPQENRLKFTTLQREPFTACCLSSSSPPP